MMPCRLILICMVELWQFFLRFIGNLGIFLLTHGSFWWLQINSRTITQAVLCAIWWYIPLINFVGFRLTVTFSWLSTDWQMIWQMVWWTNKTVCLHLLWAVRSIFSFIDSGKTVIHPWCFVKKQKPKFHLFNNIYQFHPMLERAQ